jgi:type I restriction enzyme M protein
MKAQDCPKYLRKFNETFNRLDSRSSYQVWDDFLSLSVAGLAYGEEQETINKILGNYTEKERPIVWQLFVDMMGVYKEIRIKSSWQDPLGDYYEVLSSKGDKQSFGQFFTANCVSDMMAMITVAGAQPVGKTFFDPACGSGRLLLAINARYPENFVFGCDLDRTCVKMTALNLCLQGARGEVCWKDALDDNDHRQVYLINPPLCPLPTIVEIPVEKSYIYVHNRAKSERAK